MPTTMSATNDGDDDDDYLSVAYDSTAFSTFMNWPIHWAAIPFHSHIHIFVQSTIYTHFYSPTIKHDATNDGLVQRCDAFTVSLELNVKPLERL